MRYLLAFTFGFVTLIFIAAGLAGSPRLGDVFFLVGGFCLGATLDESHAVYQNRKRAP